MIVKGVTVSRAFVNLIASDIVFFVREAKLNSNRIESKSLTFIDTCQRVSMSMRLSAASKQMGANKE